jgi:hypothetical protein
MTDGDRAILGAITVTAIVHGITLILWAIWHIRARGGGKR